MKIPPFIDSNPFVRRLPLRVRTQFEAWVDNFNTLLAVDNVRVFKNMAPSAVRGLFLQRGRSGRPSQMQARHQAHFDFSYPADNAQLRALYEKAKKLQWNGSIDLDWSIDVDPFNPDVPMLAENFVDWHHLKRLGIEMTEKERRHFLWTVSSWMLSQFLHGEQGALMASAQVTEATPIFDGKYYGASQVMDEARHVEVFHRYLDEKLERRYEINDNLFTIIDGLMTDNRWDIKFLGMQILVEGLALGAFSTLHKMTSEPLLRTLLKRVIQDEARHVHFGLVSLRPVYTEQLSERERIEREDWAFEVVVLMRNRFLAHELYEESFAHLMSRRTWNEVMESMPGMSLFRRTMFNRLVPNLKAIGLLSPRVQGRYERMGLGEFVDLPATDQMTDEAILAAG
ncbi:MAG: ferritin-like domain-containing protein [Myxococcota bacterium]|nr:ferritin-like domain-containing protein [Myxococcota bacterium]